jgi:hypothetical protein
MNDNYLLGVIKKLTEKSNEYARQIDSNEELIYNLR